MRTQIPGKQILDEGIDTVDLNDNAVTDEKLSSTGVGAGSYTKVTVTDKGRVTAGSNPTTLAGYGITDAAANNTSVLTATGESSLPRSRHLVVTNTELKITDNGEGANFILGLADNPIFPGNATITLPAGTTAQRPGAATPGMLRFNTTTAALETPIGQVWQRIVLDDDIRLTGDANVLQVRNTPKPGQFGSIAAACDSLVGVATEESQWLIDVGPGTYTEPEVVVPSFVHISGFTEYAVYIQPDADTHAVVTVQEAATVSLVNITGAGPGQYGMQLHDTGDYGVIIHKVCLFDNANGFDVKALTTNSVVYLEYCDTKQNAGIGVNVVSSNLGFSTYVNLENFYVYGDTANPEVGIQAIGPDVYINIQSFGMEGVDGTGEAFNLANSARVDVKAGSVFKWDIGVHLENTGAPSIGNFIGVALHENTSWDLSAEHPGSLGTIAGTAGRTKVNATAAPGFTLAFADTADNDYVQTGDFYMGATSSTVTNVTGLLIDTPPMGLLAGGVLSGTGGLGVSVSAGSGYLRKDGNVTFITWPTTPLTVTAGTSPYVFFNKNGVLQTSSTEPDGLTNIIIGRVGANATVVYSLGSLSIDISNYGNKVENYLRRAVGPVYVSGSIITENATTPRAIDITAGQWFYGTKLRNPSAKVAPSIQAGYHGGGTVQLALLSQVPNDKYDNGLQLVNTTAGYFTKHALYQSSEGPYQALQLAYAQAQYATLDEAVLAPLPVPVIAPDATPLIGALIMQQGVNSIAQIIDLRPMFFRTGGVSNAGGGGAQDHGDLLGLGDDDHLQYLLVNGTRAMSGDLNLNGNDITNVLTINGLDIAAHATRHLPNGADPLATGAAVTLTAATTNTAGIANSFARSDHTHQITGFQPASVELTQVAAISTNGIVIHVEPNVWATRTLTGDSNIVITNPGGIAGNPTFALGDYGTAGTYIGVTTDAKGRVTSGTTTVSFSSVSGTPTTLAGYGITDAQATDPDLTALANSAGTGYYIRTGDGTSVTRSLVAPAAGITITNPSGVAGATTFALANDLASLEAITTFGIGVHTTTDTWVTRTFVAPAAGLTIANPAGAAGNFTFALANDLAALEGIATSGFVTRTATDTWTPRTLTSATLTITNAAGIAGNPTLELTAVGSAGTYKSVTTDAYGRVTAGTNPTTLAGYGITDAVNVSQLGANSGVATLDSNGKLLTTQLPALAITDTYVVATQAEMLASGAETGDIAIRTDQSKTYVLRQMPATVLANWSELATPTDAVTSVNGQTGAVTLNFVTSVATAQPTSGLTITGGPITSSGTLTFALANDLAALESLSGTGFSIRTGTDTWTTRSLGAGAGISITNGDGVAGAPSIALSTVGTAGTYKSVTTNAYGQVTAGSNPTTLAGYGITDAQALDSDLTALANTATTGMYTITAVGASATRTLTAGTGISVTNGNGVSGNPTIALGTVGTAGTYRSVTTDATGRVTAGTNPTTLAGYGITDAINTSEKGAVNGVATLGSDGKLTTAQIPAIAISDTFVVASQAEQVALTGAEIGDIAVRTDLNKSYILRASPYSTFANWQELLTPTDAVTSVNGQTGAVTVPTGTVTSVAASAPAAGFTITGGPITSSGTLTFALANDLAALENLGGTGFAVRTAGETWAQRSITSANAGLTVTNGDGVAGNVVITLPTVGTSGTYRSVTTDTYGRVTAGTNPTTLAGYGITDAQALDSDLTALANTATTGLYTITGVGTSATRSLVAGTGISITNPTGVAGNITISATATGTVTSVGLSAPSFLTVTGSPVTTSGTLTLGLATQAINTVLAGPTTGSPAAPTFRTIGLATNDLNDVTITSATTNQVLAYNGTRWVNTTTQGTSASGLVGAAPAGGGTAWTLSSGVRYYGDFVHNLGTTNVVVTVYDSSTNNVVIPDETNLLSNSTVRITVVGNTRTLKVVVVANGNAIIGTGSTAASSVITSQNNVTINAASTKLNFLGAVVVSDAGSGQTNIVVGARYTFYANSFDTPNNSDWAVNAFAPAVPDATNPALPMRSFSNTTEQGVGMLITIPASATNVTFRFRGRPAASPASASNVGFRIYYRAIPNAGAMGAWTGFDLTTIPIPAGNTNFVFSTITSTLVAAGLVAGNSYQFELTRKVTGVTSNLASNFMLFEATFDYN